MTNLNDLSQKLINSYQKKICCYDKQQWERSIEDQILYRAENISNHSQATHSPNCTNHDRLAANFHPPMTTDLIDLDLISGSAYTAKPKSQQGWLSSFGHAILRILFFPLYLRWWSERTSAILACLLLLLYLLQVTALRLYYHRGITLFTIHNLPAAFSTNETTSPGNVSTASASAAAKAASNEFAEVSPTEVLMPIAMMFVLGVIHTQMVGTKLGSTSHSASSCSSSSSATSVSSSSAPSSRMSSSIRCGCNHSLSKCVQSSESLYCSTHTEHSSSSISSCTSTPKSSVERPRKQKRVKKDLRGRTIPKIRIQGEQKRVEIVLVHDEPDSFNGSELEDRPLENSTDNFSQNSSLPPLRRYSDSKTNGASACHSVPSCRRRFSESQCDQVKLSVADVTGKFSSTSLPAASRRKLFNGRLLKGPALKRKCRFEHNWPHSRSQASLSPKTNMDKPYLYYGNTNGSSYESEGTASPVTPMASHTCEDWPMINSDASGESEEENQFKPTFPLESKPPPAAKPGATGCECASFEGKGHFAKSGAASECGTFARKSVSEAAPSIELKVSCSIWQQPNGWQKVDLSVMDLSSAIIRKVEGIEHSSEYVYLGIIFSLAIAILPTIFRMQYLLSASGNSPNNQASGAILSSPTVGPNNSAASSTSLPVDYQDYFIQIDLFGLLNLFLDASLFFGKSFRLRFVICIAMFERFVLSLFYFFLLCVAERTFKQRFLYSKYFSQITRRDRAKRSQVPFFRLHKVSYLKVWLSVRSYLRRHGPLRSVDTICSTSFILAVCLLTCNCLQLLKDTSDTYTSRLICWEMIFWSLAIGIYIMRLMILGSRINQKYRSNLSVLITEQINLHLQLERKPQKKDDLMLANHVLKLAADLIKELEAPYKISGFSANPYLYNVTKVVVLSAFSGLLSEMLGFKLKLDKINLIK